MQSNSRNIVLILVAVLVVGLGAYAAPKITDLFSQTEEPYQETPHQEEDYQEEAYQFKGGKVIDPRRAPELDLHDQYGEPFHLEDRIGKAVLVFFGYTYCPDICPMTLYDFTRVKKELGPLGDRVEFVFVTVDGERDTPERLREYVDLFDPSFVALRGDKESIDRVTRAYGAGYVFEPVDDPEIGYLVGHTGFIYLIDPAGVQRVIFTPNHTVEDMVEDTRYLIESYDAQLPPVVIENAWARTGLPGGNTAAYFSVRNTGSELLNLVEAESGAARIVEIHETAPEMREVDGQLVEILTMREVESVEVAAGSQVELRPGGLHVMLVNLNQALHDGDHISLVLRFDGYAPLRLDVPVRTAPGGEDHDHHHDHDH